jgi:hypothetical protein
MGSLIELADPTKDLGFDPDWSIDPPKLEFDHAKRYVDRFGAVWYWTDKAKTWGNDLREHHGPHEVPPDKYAPYTVLGG